MVGVFIVASISNVARCSVARYYNYVKNHLIAGIAGDLYQDIDVCRIVQFCVCDDERSQRSCYITNQYSVRI